MLVLTDESLSRRPSDALTAHDARTVTQMGWRGTSNGALLRRSEAAGFGVLITADRDLDVQQDVARFGLCVIVVMGPRTNPNDVLPLAPQIEHTREHRTRRCAPRRRRPAWWSLTPILIRAGAHDRRKPASQEATCRLPHYPADRLRQPTSNTCIIPSMKCGVPPVTGSGMKQSSATWPAARSIVTHCVLPADWIAA